MSSVNIKGPTSAQKKRRGRPRGSKQDKIIISDLDVQSCFLGIVESIVTGKAIIVKDLHTDRLIHCTTHKLNTKFFNKGMPVVFSYIGNKNGEIIANYSSDNMLKLTYHFKINDNKAIKQAGQITNINKINTSIDNEFDDIITNLEQININDNLLTTKINNSSSSLSILDNDKELDDISSDKDSVNEDVYDINNCKPLIKILELEENIISCENIQYQDHWAGQLGSCSAATPEELLQGSSSTPGSLSSSYSSSNNLFKDNEEKDNEEKDNEEKDNEEKESEEIIFKENEINKNIIRNNNKKNLQKTRSNRRYIKYDLNNIDGCFI